MEEKMSGTYFAGICQRTDSGKYDLIRETDKRPQSTSKTRMIATFELKEWGPKQTSITNTLETLITGLNNGILKPTKNEITRKLTQEGGFADLVYYGKPPVHTGRSQPNLKDNSQILPGESYGVHEFIESKRRRNILRDKKPLK